jgi:hypothetical protein
MRKSLLLGLNICAAATLTLALLIVAGGFSTARAQATTSVKCKDGTVTVSTGDSSGTCEKKGGAVINCTTGGERVAQGGCDLNGRATCSSTTGSGSCTIAAGGGAAGTGGTTTKGKVGVTAPASAGALQGPSGGTTSTAGSKAKLPTSGGTTAK